MHIKQANRQNLALIQSHLHNRGARMSGHQKFQAYISDFQISTTKFTLSIQTPQHITIFILISTIPFYYQLLSKLEMCPQYTDAPVVGYLTIKLQNSTWYKCLNLSLTGLRTYERTYVLYVHTFVQKDIHSYAHTENRKTICPWHHPMRGHKN